MSEGNAKQIELPDIDRLLCVRRGHKPGSTDENEKIEAIATAVRALHKCLSEAVKRLNEK